MKNNIFYILLLSALSYSEAGTLEQELSGVNARGAYDIVNGTDKEGDPLYFQDGPGNQFIAEVGDYLRAGKGPLRALFKYIDGEYVLLNEMRKVMNYTGTNTMPSRGTSQTTESDRSIPNNVASGTVGSGTTKKDSIMSNVGISGTGGTGTMETPGSTPFGVTSVTSKTDYAPSSGSTPQSSDGTTVEEIEFDIHFVVKEVDLSKFFTPASLAKGDLSNGALNSSSTLRNSSGTTNEEITFDINFVIKEVDLSSFFNQTSLTNDDLSSSPSTTELSSEISTTGESTTQATSTGMTDGYTSTSTP